MDNSNKVIARRINKELRIRKWTQTYLLRKIIKFKNPDISNRDLQDEVIRRKGNFSTTLKGNHDRSISKEDLYIISKILRVPLEYLWFGEEKKNGFISKGAPYAAYQDIDTEYRTYMASLEYEDKIQHEDEFGFSLFDYFGQYDSINGYRYFAGNYNLHFDYVEYGELTYVNSEGYPQLCSSENKKHVTSDNLIMVLSKHNDTKTFKKVFFDNCSLKRFDSDHAYYRNEDLFSDYFLETLLTNESFFELILKTREVDIGCFNKYYGKNVKRYFVEPMLYEALFYALKHEDEFKERLTKMLRFVIGFSKLQYEFIKEYLKAHIEKDEYSDVHIDQRAPNLLRSSRNIPMGNVFKIREKLSDESLNNMLKEIEQYTFNMTHIINVQEKNNDEIKISTPNNPLFEELIKNSMEQKASFVPIALHFDKEFTYFQSYETIATEFENIEHLRFIVDCLNKAQNLVSSKPNKVLVHGDMNSRILVAENGKLLGLSGWQQCHYGNKYEDRAELLANINDYSYRDDYLKKYEIFFGELSQGFNHEEKIKLIDRAIDILTERRKTAIAAEDSRITTICWLKERASKLELFKELYLAK